MKEWSLTVTLDTGQKENGKLVCSTKIDPNIIFDQAGFYLVMKQTACAMYTRLMLKFGLSEPLTSEMIFTEWTGEHEWVTKEL